MALLLRSPLLLEVSAAGWLPLFLRRLSSSSLPTAEESRAEGEEREGAAHPLRLRCRRRPSPPPAPPSTPPPASPPTPGGEERGGVAMRPAVVVVVACAVGAVIIVRPTPSAHATTDDPLRPRCRLLLVVCALPPRCQ
uniref:Uncharacterized protein n=1 Tax=Oryza nivara TaxID=4536 RepID=A0A0E0FMR9_ORYNI